MLSDQSSARLNTCLKLRDRNPSVLFRSIVVRYDKGTDALIVSNLMPA